MVINLRSKLVFLVILLFASCSPAPNVIQPTPAPTQIVATPTTAASPTTALTATPLPTDTPASPTPPPTNTPLPPTNTPAPSATPVSTSTPTPGPTDTPKPAATSAGSPKVIMSDGVNLRSGPGTNFSVIASGKQGDTYDITARNADGSWLQICCIDSNQVWVAMSVIDTVGDLSGVPLAQQIPPTPTGPAGFVLVGTPNMAGFRNYQDAASSFILSYPPAYNISQRHANSLDLDNPKRGMSVFVISDTVPADLLTGNNSDTYVNSLITPLSKGIDNLQVVNKGVVTNPNALQIEMTGKLTSNGNPVQLRFLLMPLDATHEVLGYLLAFGDALNDGDRQDLARTVGSVKLAR